MACRKDQFCSTEGESALESTASVDNQRFSEVMHSYTEEEESGSFLARLPVDVACYTSQHFTVYC